MIYGQDYMIRRCVIACEKIRLSLYGHYLHMDVECKNRLCYFVL